MYHVRTKITRVDGKLIESFRKLTVATVYEGAGRIGSVDPAIKPLRKGLRLVGPAYTVKCCINDNLMLHKALQAAQEGDVLVASVGNYPDAGYWGDLMTTIAVARKLGGLIINGSIRDSEEIIESGFPVFCTGVCIRGTNKRELGLINHPLFFGDVMVNPGDLVLGDDDGLVIVPRELASQVLESSLARIEREKVKLASYSKGVTSVEMNNLDELFSSLGMKEEK